MITAAEIGQAIEHLAAAERETLEARVLVRRFGLEASRGDERVELLESLDEAEREIDGGQGLSGDDLRQAVRSWAGR